MHKLKNRAVVVISLLAVFALSGAALAASESDTVINYGYDEESEFFMWNVTSLDYEPWLEAAEADEELSADDFEALLAACGLDTTGEGTDFNYTVELNEDDSFAITVTPIEEEGGEESEGEDDAETFECGEWNGDFVTGPNGQVNHGMFMKTFNEIYDGPHRGCIIRHIAQSDLGKGDQQVRVPDVEDDEETEGDEATEEEFEGLEGTVTIKTTESACLKGKNGDDDDDEDDGEGRRGPPDHVLEKFDGHPKDKKGKPDHAGKGRP